MTETSAPVAVSSTTAGATSNTQDPHRRRHANARLVRLHANDVASRMKSRNCCWGAMTYSPTAAACFPATRRAGAWATGVTGPNVCEGGPVSDERPFDGLPRGHFGAILADPPWEFRHVVGARTRPIRRTRHYARRSRLRRSSRCRSQRSQRRTRGCFCGPVDRACSLRDSDVIERMGLQILGLASSGPSRTPPVSAGTGAPASRRGRIAELCLLATRGKPQRLQADVHQLIIQPRREHSPQAR